MELYDYQKKVMAKMLKRLIKHRVVFLAGEERIGKTLVTLSTLKELKVKSVLFITVKAAINDIQEDYIKGGFDYYIHVTNYEQMKNLTGDYDAIVFDESSKISAYPKANGLIKSGVTLVHRMNPKYRILLNATPSVETYSQFFHPLRVVEFFDGTFYKWWHKYGIPDLSVRIAGGMAVESYKKVNNKAILKMVKPIMITFTRRDAGFEQTRTKVKYIDIKPSKKMLKAYHKMEKDSIYKHIAAETGAARMAKLQQITGGFIYDEDLEVYTISNDKLLWLTSNINPKKEKVAIYCKYRHEINILHQAFGTMSYAEFKHAKSGVFIAQVKSGAKGIDLSSADKHYFYSLDYSGETFVQGIARQHNKKRKKKVVAHILTVGLIDKDIAQVVTQKRKFNLETYRRLQK